LTEPLRLTLKNMGLAWKEAAAAIVILKDAAHQQSHTHTHWDEQDTVNYDFQGDYDLLRDSAQAFYGPVYGFACPAAAAVDRQGTSRREVVLDFKGIKPALAL
jgi:hypothetical protein